MGEVRCISCHANTDANLVQTCVGCRGALCPDCSIQYEGKCFACNEARNWDEAYSLD